ncbi:MAG: trypsin-like peptidase domain-containing protein [Elusimicrobia bacterium]|nr:trypsin-like peptidase domain-containing protein [Elusimicrobiota bacterium]
MAPVDILLTREIPQDEAALATTGPEKGERLAKLQSDLALVAEGLEGFASEEDAKPSLKRLREAVDSPDQFKDRASALDAAYRALAVVDYTWAKRLPEAPCSPESSRARLLKSDSLSSWLASLLGPGAGGTDTAAKLDEASAIVPASAREYALLRAKINRLTRALGSEKAVGSIRAALYCRRAGAYEALSGANRAAPAGLVAASRAVSADDASGVYLLARKDSDGLEILGAATAVEDSLVTDGRLADGEGLVILRRGKKGLIPVRIARRDGSGLALLRADVPVKGFVLAEGSPAKDDLIEAVGHPERTGAWTRVRGLVTSADSSSFQTDAAIDVGMTGGAALTEDGRLAGVFVLRSARSEGKSFDWPVAVSAPALKAWLAGGELAAPSAPIELSESGTASIQTASRLLLDRRAPGAQATEASHLYFYDGNTRAVCKANCDDAAPSSGSSYSSNGGAELGAALGKAMAPMVEALIFRGIPALFRGIGSLFKSNPSAAPKGNTVAEKKREESKPAPKPKPKPKPELKVRLAAAQDQDGQYVFTATITSADPEQLPLGGHETTFTVNGTTTAITRTNAAGVAILYVDNPPPSIAAHKGLDEESAKHPWLTETGRTFGDNVCYAALGATVLTLEVTVVVVATAAGGPAGPATATLCVQANPAIIAGALALCALAKETETAANKPPIKQPAPAAPPIVKTERDRVEAASDKHHDSLDAEAREQAISEGQSTPRDPNDPGDDENELDQIEKTLRSDLKKPSAEDSELKKVINDLFQPTDRYPGGTAGALRREAMTKVQTGNRWHAQKAQDNINRLNRLLRTRKMSDVDRMTAEAIKADLQHSVEAWARSKIP